MTLDCEELGIECSWKEFIWTGADGKEFNGSSSFLILNRINVYKDLAVRNFFTFMNVFFSVLITDVITVITTITGLRYAARLVRRNMLN